MKTALLIMAAGLGSRYGGGIKQIQPVGPNNEIIMDYSIHDAMEAGFDRIIFVIRKDIEQDFMDAIGHRIEEEARKHGVEICYAYQDIQDIPAAVPEGRTKPWGTGHAVLAAKDYLDMPYLVINADDYYGKEGFQKMHDFLELGTDGLAMAGFVLDNTLSENGGVTRGIVQADETGNVTDIQETKNIVRDGEQADADGKKIPLDSHVSMNMWGYTPAFTQALEAGFADFLANMQDPLKDEFLLPTFTNDLVKQGKATVQLVPTPDKWFGITFTEDLPSVKESFADLYAQGVYASEGLFSDLEQSR